MGSPTFLFSHEFLRVSGQDLNASGEAHGEFATRTKSPRNHHP
jgi:hypothetical protein